LQRDVSGYEKVMSRSVSVGVYSHVCFMCEVSTVREKTVSTIKFPESVGMSESFGDEKSPVN
jgi:hypothetical protein